MQDCSEVPAAPEAAAAATAAAVALKAALTTLASPAAPTSAPPRGRWTQSLLMSEGTHKLLIALRGNLQ